MRFSIPLLTLAACSEVPTDIQRDCAPQMEAFEQSCQNAEVIGSHNNNELHAALADVRECAGQRIHAVCSDDGYVKGVTWSWDVHEKN